MNKHSDTQVATSEAELKFWGLSTDGTGEVSKRGICWYFFFFQYLSESWLDLKVQSALSIITANRFGRDASREEWQLRYPVTIKITGEKTFSTWVPPQKLKMDPQTRRKGLCVTQRGRWTFISWKMPEKTLFFLENGNGEERFWLQSDHEICVPGVCWLTPRRRSDWEMSQIRVQSVCQHTLLSCCLDLLLATIMLAWCFSLGTLGG